MLITVCKSKIHRATITEANLNYEGSITIDTDLMKAADIVPFEKVQIANIANGERLETYVIEGDAGSERRARHDHVAGLKAHEEADGADDFDDAKDHLRGVAVLAAFAVDLEPHVEPLRIGNVVGGHQPWSERSEGVA